MYKYANIWHFGLVQGICLGIDIQWKGDMIHDEDWGFDLYLGFIRVSFIRCNDIKNLPDYGHDIDLFD